MNASLLILVDDLSIRDLLRLQLERDHDLIFVESGAEVIAAVKERAIDLIIIDVTMATLDRLAVLRDLRSELTGTALPVLLISSPDNNSAAVQGLQFGANDYVTKPLDMNVVRERIGTQIALKCAEDQRKQTINQLKFTQEMQETLTRIVSHDLKGPLTNVRMAQFMLRDILHDNVEARSILDNMDVTLNGMVEIIRTFLDAMDSRKLEAKPEPMYVHDIIVEVVGQYHLAAQRKQIQLQIQDSERQQKVHADHRLLKQVLANLVSNALKFSPHGTQTTIWTERHDDVVRLCVADQGPGIPAEEREKLFQMFSKLSPRPTGGEASTGLGLWIAKELTHLQDGEIGVDQASEGGSVFWVELPAA